MIDVRMKGQRAERQVRALLQSVVTYAYQDYGLDVPILERNLQQSIDGGEDIRGLDWIAVEVKHQETVKVSTWWKQTCEQAGTDLLGRPVDNPPTEGIRPDGFIDGRLTEARKSRGVSTDQIRIPILFWRSNKLEWNIVMIALVKSGDKHVRMRVTVDWPSFRVWFDRELRLRLADLVKDGKS